MGFAGHAGEMKKAPEGANESGFQEGRGIRQGAAAQGVRSDRAAYVMGIRGYASGQIRHVRNIAVAILRGRKDAVQQASCCPPLPNSGCRRVHSPAYGT